MDLPITAHKRQILYSLEYNQVLLLSAETGCGKTTQLPQYLVQAGYTLQGKKIAVVLPRRLAAISIAQRVAAQLSCTGGQVAHKVRFDSTATDHSRLLFLTDGTLVQQLHDDPLLLSYSVVILDDVHERSLNYDILIAFLKRILTKRNEFRLIITSATIHTHTLKDYFERESVAHVAVTCASLNILGRLHGVKVHYLKRASKNYFLKIFQTIVYIDRERRDGDILVFLPSVEEIEGMKHMLDSYAGENRRTLTILPLHSQISLAEQSAIFDHCSGRKVILATNIAESSITIAEVRYVVDSGYTRIKVFKSKEQVEKLITVQCGQSSAVQRSGRAGRTQEGECFRMYTEQAFISMRAYLPPEIERVDLSCLILTLKGLGITNILSFQMVQPLGERRMAEALDVLSAYELINEQFELTEKGEKVVQLPITLKNACMLLSAFDPAFGCAKEVLMLVAMLEVQKELFAVSGIPILKVKKKIGAKEGDFLTLINLFSRCMSSKDKKRTCAEYKLRLSAVEKAMKIHQELKGCIRRINNFKTEEEKMQHLYGEKKANILQIKSSLDSYQSILRCILKGYFMNVAQMQGDGSYLNVRSKEKLQLHATSVLSVVYPEWVVYYEVMYAHSRLIYLASTIYPEWLFELLPHYYVDERVSHVQKDYLKQKETQREAYKPKKQEEPIKGLLEVGKTHKNPLFNVQVLALKNVKNKKKSLSFQQDL